MTTPSERLMNAARMVLATSGYVELPFHLAMTDVGLRWAQGLRDLRDAVYDMDMDQRLERDRHA